MMACWGPIGPPASPSVQPVPDQPEEPASKLQLEEFVAGADGEVPVGVGETPGVFLRVGDGPAVRVGLAVALGVPLGLGNGVRVGPPRPWQYVMVWFRAMVMSSMSNDGSPSALL